MDLSHPNEYIFYPQDLAVQYPTHFGVLVGFNKLVRPLGEFSAEETMGKKGKARINLVDIGPYDYSRIPTAESFSKTIFRFYMTISLSTFCVCDIL